MTSELSPFQQKLYAFMLRSADADVPIISMYNLLYDDMSNPQHDKVLVQSDARYMQQKLGPIIQRINDKLPDGQHIEPGLMKRTYRLNTNYAPF